MAELTKIPSPPGWPIFGNLFQMPRETLTQHFTEQAKQFPGIFRLSFAGYPVTFVSSPELVHELADAKRFRKLVGPPLSFLRDLAGDGLFTAHSHEPNWDSAHRVLVPAFGQRAMRGYYELMLPVAQELVNKWTLQQGKDIDVTEDMTRYTLETIGVAGFGYRFDLFSSEKMHPFTDAMYAVLTEAMARLTRVRIPTPSSYLEHRKFKSNNAFMHQLVDNVIAQRRAHPIESRDLLGLMLEATDETTGKKLTDENIRFQVITFLIAGHETTSGLLSFALYFLLANPKVLAQVVNEIDQVLPNKVVPSYDNLSQLKVVDRVIKETLRLWPTAPVYSVAPFEDTVIGGQFKIRRNHRLNILLPAVHRHASVWVDPDAFDIDRFLPAQEAHLPSGSYKPFGNGERACIGRQFANAEAKLALALLLQNFKLEEPYGYQLQVKETLSLKPQNFKIRATPR